ncbi:hypothetical protein IMX26_15275 [Clostridium sp. 'deep sea']|uniref:hypothetical protein n=1 Tax=Clostridium sp. 'deep sea' TaxID=2779445 RepID=UPI0018966A46|nr:hypothetical protein [Clostridium sp. 'deep sea']QOR34802.1 hypothetical protein IMX26_15275 [Clostridium sp. 'deep sea']
MKFLMNIDRRIIYILVFLAIAIPMLKPVGLPFSINESTQNFFNEVDALKPGDVVVVSYDYDPSSQAQIEPQAKAVLKHLYNKEGIKIINLAFWPSGPLFTDKYLKEMQGSHNKEYGEDYVSLGYIAGGETAISSFAKDIKKCFSVDRLGNKTSSLAMLKNINSAKDISLFITFGSGTPGLAEHIRQVQSVYGTKMVAGMSSVSVAGYLPYYNAGQIKGYLNGLRGAAEYETLLKEPGAATSAMDSLSFAHMIVIVFIILGNIAYFTNPQRKIRG